MSQDTPPHMPAVPPPPPEPTARKSRTNVIIISSAAAVIAAIVATGIVVTQSGHGGSEPTATVGPSLYGMEGTAAAVPESSPGTEMEPTYSDLDADDFTMELRTTSRQCFGSAGCNVTVEPELTYVGVFNGIDPNVVYEITYKIQGDESGPVIQTAELSNETTLNYRPSTISTASSGTKVSVQITDVAIQGR